MVSTCPEHVCSWMQHPGMRTPPPDPVHAGLKKSKSIAYETIQHGFTHNAKLLFGATQVNLQSILCLHLLNQVGGTYGPLGAIGLYLPSIPANMANGQVC